MEYEQAVSAWWEWDKQLGRVERYTKASKNDKKLYWESKINEEAIIQEQNERWKSKKHLLAGSKAIKEALIHEKKAVEILKEIK